MTDILEFLSTVHWPGALIVAVAFWFAGCVVWKVRRG